MKKCSICKQEKEEICFSFQNKKEKKLMSACKECQNKKIRYFRKNNPELQKQKDRINYQRTKEHRVVYAREYRKNNPEKTMDINLKSRYGITRKEYLEILNKQNNKCAICGKPRQNHSRNFALDHNHKTGKIRGIVCDGCNYGIGFLENHIDEYIKYLIKHDVDVMAHIFKELITTMEK
jgi:hypothetical protein